VTFGPVVGDVAGRSSTHEQNLRSQPAERVATARRQAMRVAELMRTPAVVCRPTTSLKEAANMMEARNVGSVLVVDNIGYLTGIVTDRDLALKGAGQGRSPDVTVESIMTRDVASVAPTSDVSEASAIMQKRSVRRVPVVDDRGTIHGMVAFDDLFRNLSHEADDLMDTVLSQAIRLHASP